MPRALALAAVVLLTLPGVAVTDVTVKVYSLPQGGGRAAGRGVGARIRHQPAGGLPDEVTRGAGALGLALALGAVTASAPRADPARGERVFQRCYACHSVVAGEDRLPVPTLRCVLGRRAGSLPGFEFSPARADAGGRGLTWTRTTPDAFLADPLAVVPGTTMALPGLGNADDRRDLLDYLEGTGRCAGRHPAPGSPAATAPSPASGSPSVTGGVATT